MLASASRSASCFACICAFDLIRAPSLLFQFSFCACACAGRTTTCRAAAAFLVRFEGCESWKAPFQARRVLEQVSGSRRGGEMAVEHRSDVYRNGTGSDLANASRMKSSVKHRSSSWLQTDPEMRRKKRVAKYKVFTVEGKVKQTVRNSCRWIKEKYVEVRYGWF